MGESEEYVLAAQEVRKVLGEPQEYVLTAREAASSTHPDLLPSVELATEPVEDYPIEPSPPHQYCVALTEAEMQHLLRRTLYAVEEGSYPRPALTGVLFLFRPPRQCAAVATDGVRLALVSLQTWHLFEEERTLLIPGRVLKEAYCHLLRATDSDVLVSVSQEGSQERVFLQRETGLWMLSCRLLEWKQFPDFLSVIPTSGFTRMVKVVREDLLSALKRITQPTSARARLDISEDKIDILARRTTWEKSEKVTVWKSVVPAEVTGPPITIEFNPGYLMDFCLSTDATHVTIRIQDKRRAAVLTAEDEEDYLCVLMPMREEDE